MEKPIRRTLLTAAVFAWAAGAWAAPASPVETNTQAALFDQANRAFQADDYAAAYRQYDAIFQDAAVPFVLKRAAYYRREQCLAESFTGIQRSLLAGQLDRGQALLDQAEAFAARGSIERARLDLFRARLLHARGGAADAPEIFLQRLLADTGPFAPAVERSEAWFLLWQWAKECGDEPAASAARQGLRNDPAPDPYWAWRMDPAGWADCNYGPRRHAEFDAVLAQAGRPQAAIMQAEGWLARMTVTNLAGLTNGLEQLRQLPAAERMGRIVFVPGGHDWDLHGQILNVPEGVILAGDRGIDGAPGPILRCGHFASAGAFIMLQSHARITGFRILGERDPDSRPGFVSAGTAAVAAAASGPGTNHAAAAQSAPGSGVGLAWGAVHGAVDNCEIAWFGRDGVHTHGHYLRVADCHIHNVGGYGVLMGIYGSHLLVERSRIDWLWQAIGGGRSMIVGYEIRQCVIEDARRVENSRVEKGSEYFHYGTAMGHHSDLGGLRVHVWGNVFPRADLRVLGMRTVSPRNGPGAGAFVHNNWFPRPYLADQPPAVRADLLAMLRQRGKSGDAMLLADYVAGADYDPREMEIRLRNQLANLWAWRNFYGEACAEIPVSAWTAPMVQWLMPRVLPPTFRLKDPASLETVLRLKRQADGQALIPLAWEVRMFPGRQLTALSVKVTGPFDEVLPGIGKDGAFVREIYRESGAARAESAAIREVAAALPAPGFYRLDLCVADTGGRVIRYPGFVYYGLD